MLEAFDTLFNKRDYAAASRFWSDQYIQHSAHIEPGREGLFGLIRAFPTPCATSTVSSSQKATTSSSTAAFRVTDNLRHGSAADVVRIENGVLAEHWDVLQDEATKAESKSGLPMFGDRFPA